MTTTDPDTDVRLAVAAGALIRRYRTERGFSQEQLATKIGYSKSMVGNVEHGRHRLNHRTRRAFSRALHIPEHEWSDLHEEEVAQ